MALCQIDHLVREPDVARSSGRIGSIAVAEASMPLRSAAALSMVDLAVLLLRTSAVLLLLSPIVIFAVLAFA